MIIQIYFQHPSPSLHQKILLGAFPMSLMYFLVVSFEIVSNGLNTQHLGGVLRNCIQRPQHSTSWWCPSKLYPMPSTINILVPLLYTKKNKNSCPTQCSQCFQLTFSTSLLLLVDILSSLVNILVFLMFFIFHHPWCCLGVFYLLSKLKSFPNQTLH